MKPILIVEPSALEAAKAISGDFYEVTTPYNKIEDAGQPILLWPDATNASREFFREMANSLSHGNREIKIVIPSGQPDAWNIASAVTEGWDWPKIVEWAKANVIDYLSIQTTEAPDPARPEARKLWESLGLALSAAGTPILNIDNVARILQRHPDFENIIWFDEFHQRYFTAWHSFNERQWREWGDVDNLQFTRLLQQEFGLSRISDEVVSKALVLYGQSRPRNEPRDWIHGLKWDGKPRIDRFFIDYLGTKETPYAYAIGRNFWIGLVARVYAPGCQLDNMVILEGRQGTFKTSALRAIGGKWYMEAHEQITSKDFFLSLQGRLIVELSELDAFSKADATRIKQVISCNSDRYRAPYARSPQDNPRRSVFVGSTNERHYLRDNTGARRFWPIACGVIRLEALRRDREQLFAEARTRYLTGEDWHTVPAESTGDEQEARRQFDEWENIIGEYVSTRSEVNLTELAAHMGFDKSKLDMAAQRRMGSILRQLRWEPRVARKGFSILRLWYPVDSNGPQDPLPSSDKTEPLPVKEVSQPASAGWFDS